MNHRPSGREFFRRVGGFFILVFISIMSAKIFFPGYEAIASMMACLVTVIFLIIEHSNKRKKHFANRARKKNRVSKKTP